MFTPLRRLGLAALCLLALSACNLDDTAPRSQFVADGEACTSDDACVSGLCLNGLKVCAATCEDSCEGDLVCTEGHCLPADYCDEGFGPGCALTGCEPSCHADATCDLQAEGGPTCVCNQGFEGDGSSCTLVDENPCLIDNGGCGDPELVQCDALVDADSGEREAQCTLINPCITANGGCGDPEFFTCLHTGVGDRECADVDVCADANGGCGDPERYACVPRSGAPPLCRFVASCDVAYEASLVYDSFVSSNDVDGIFVGRPFLVTAPHGFDAENEGYQAANLHQTYLMFELQPLSALRGSSELDVTAIHLDMQVMPSSMSEGAGVVTVHQVANEWYGANLRYSNRPPVLFHELSRMPVFLDGAGLGDHTLRLQGELLSQRVLESVNVGARYLSLMLESEEVGIFYYSNRYNEGAKAPKLSVIANACDQQGFGAQANATVSRSEPDTALGEGDGLVADRDRSEFYVRFDMSQIPVGSEIVGAQLELVAIDATSFGGDATFTLDYLTTEVWDEASVTYSSRPAAAGAELATFTVDTSETRDHAQRIILDTTELFETVAERFEAEQSISLRVAASGDAATFAGRNHSQTAWHPRLTVIYE
ncbi:hypothetical protein DV096_13865 [Bradymonadaceae bacterium TMQ3]|nr:hypothetical protein DV096_13865 [Bradymonadaceae bacterium TMQ3]TXC75138.1 DNRLRE domain-containing protein [Bradymonadales bacterium TMQ1]